MAGPTTHDCADGTLERHVAHEVAVARRPGEPDDEAALAGKRGLYGGAATRRAARSIGATAGLQVAPAGVLRTT